MKKLAAVLIASTFAMGAFAQGTAPAAAASAPMAKDSATHAKHEKQAAKHKAAKHTKGAASKAM
ncbi:hypothetical protein BH09PSE5_BH09PSE5_45830 [soil metagenome]